MKFHERKASSAWDIDLLTLESENHNLRLELKAGLRTSSSEPGGWGCGELVRQNCEQKCEAHSPTTFFISRPPPEALRAAMFRLYVCWLVQLCLFHWLRYLLHTVKSRAFFFWASPSVLSASCLRNTELGPTSVLAMQVELFSLMG